MKNLLSSFLSKTLPLAILLLFAANTLLLHTHQAYGQTWLGQDDAENYGTWSGNGGFGFGEWVLNDQGDNSGHFLGNSTADGHADINTDGKAFGMFGHSNQFSNAERAITNWGDGAVFSVQLATKWRDGARGINLYNGDEDEIWNFNITNDGYGDTEWGYNASIIITFEITQNGDTLDITVSAPDQSDYITDIPNETLAGFGLYTGGDHGSEGQRNLFFNNLSITVPGINDVPSNVFAVITESETLTQNIEISGLTIESGGSLSFDDEEILTLSTGHNLVNNGTFTAGSGTVAFAGDNSISGNITFNRVELNGGASFTSDSEISGTLQINANGAINNGETPVYLNGSTLRFNTGTTEQDPYILGEGSPWFRNVQATEAPQRGVPWNVVLSGNTFVRSDLPNNVFRDIKNNLTIEAGSGLLLHRTESGADISGLYVGNDWDHSGVFDGGTNEGGNRFILDGNLTIFDGGEIKLGNQQSFVNGDLDIRSGGTLTLGDAIPGDLIIRGDWSNNGTFSANRRAVFFQGDAKQSVENKSPSNDIEIDFFINDNEEGVEVISDYLTVIQLENNAGSVLDIGSNTLRLKPDPQGTVTPNIQNDGTINVSNGTLSIFSGGMLIDNGTINGDVTFERLLSEPDFESLPRPEDEEASGLWVALSSPAAGTFAGSNGLLSNLWTQGFPGSNSPGISGSLSNVLFFTYEDETPVWYPPENNDLVPGRGFFFFLYEYTSPEKTQKADYTQPLQLSGEPYAFNGGNFALDVSNEWNLVGNPFGSALDWENAGNWVDNNMKGFAYVWDPQDAQYKTMERGEPGGGLLLDPVIAPFQAFWVETDDVNASLAIEPAARIIDGNNSQLFKPSERPEVILKLEAANRTSRSGLRFGHQFENCMDLNSVPVHCERDAYFLTPFSTTYAALYSVVEDNPIMLKSLPLDWEEEISLWFNALAYEANEPYDGPAMLTWPEILNLPENWNLVLRDHLTGTDVSLSDQDSYAFNLEASFAKHQNLGPDAFTPSSPVAQASNESKRFELIISKRGVHAEIPSDLPESIYLSQNYPNPFNPATRIEYHIPEKMHVTLAVYDMLGRKVSTLVNERQAPGVYQIDWNAQPYSSGFYLYQMNAGGETFTRRMTLLK